MNKNSLAYQNKIKYIKEYNAKNTVKKLIQFNKNNENDMAILDYLKEHNFSGYIKNLVIEDMKRQQ